MKRLWLAVALLALVLGLCVSSQTYLQQQTEAVLMNLTALEDSYRRGDLEEARRWAQWLAEEYPRRTELFYCFLAHSDLEDSRETVATLPAILEQNHLEELLTATARLREQLQHLQSIDRPTLDNVF